MGLIKRWLEDIAEELGVADPNSQEVFDEASKRLNEWKETNNA